MQPRTKRILRLSAWIGLGLFVLIGVAGSIAYAKREALLKAALERIVRKADQSYGVHLTIEEARFSGPVTVSFQKIRVVPAHRDPLLVLDHAEVSVNPWPLFLGKIRVSQLNLQNGLFHVVRRDSLTNLDFLLHRKNADSTASKSRVDLSDVAENLVDNVLGNIPEDLDIQNLEFRFTDNGRRTSLLTQTAVVDNEELTSTLLLNGREATWHLKGHLDGAGEEADVVLAAEKGPLQLAYLREKFGLELSIGALRIQLNDVNRSNGELHVEGGGSVQNLQVYHPALSADTVRVENAGLDAIMAVGENYVGLDSNSVIRLGKVTARPFLRYTLSPVKLYDAALHTDDLSAQDVFDSFPPGLFESVEGIRVTGKLRYDARLHLDSSLPDSVEFDAGMTPTNFQIQRLGRVDFARINEPFDYTPYEDGKPVRTIRIGPENPDFTPLNAISQNLRNAVLTAEDFSFFQHKGFNEKAFRVSIATDYKSGSFKRGGSTISMQLVKNAFLSRHKDVARKVEEILIVWLIENQHLVSKARMYEVYLNIIEWGRNIYGIGEAAHYYFNEDPGNLSLGESLFLAYVVPSPKSALSHFNPDGSLKQYLRGYFKFVGRIMARRGLVAYDSSAYGYYGVHLREGLRQRLFPDYDSTSVSTDSTFTMPEPNIEAEEPETKGGGINGFFRRLFGGAKDESEEAKPQTVTPVDPGVAAPATQPVVEKSRKELRQERREQRRQEKEERKKETP